ncbi:MAG TPA: hypothetical protein DCO72_07670 [Ruminococcus sp.]|nr:hypothetical protein [Ruminococcus sp.]
MASDRIDFTDRGIINIYESLSAENVRALETFIDGMESLCRRLSYKPMMNFTNSIIDFYEGEFRSHVMSCFEQWNNSDFSIDRLALRCGAGRDAANTGRGYMEELRYSLSEMFTRSFTRLNTDNSSPTLDDKDILKANELISILIRTADRIKDEAVGQCSSRSDQNMVYMLLQSVIKNTGESMCECFRSMLSRVEEGSDLYRAGIMSVMDSMTVGNIMSDNAPKWPDYDDFI